MSLIVVLAIGHEIVRYSISRQTFDRDELRLLFENGLGVGLLTIMRLVRFEREHGWV